MKPLTTARLRNRLKFFRQVRVSNGKGGFTTDWDEYAQPFAEVIGLAGREEVLARALQGIEAYRVTIRWRSDVKPADEIEYQGKRLNIRSAVDPDDRRRELVILADTEVASR